MTKTNRMTNLDDLKTSFGRKLDASKEKLERRFDADLAGLREALLRQVHPALPADIARRLAGVDKKLGAVRRRSSAVSDQPSAFKGATPGQPLLDLGGKAPLRDLDSAFADIFALERYYPLEPLKVPTVYCESLEEFFTPLVEGLNLSDRARREELERSIAEAEQIAAHTGGGYFGYNLPGQGCYLNGWLFVYGQGIPPRAAFENPDLLHRVLSTATHEKLGHGFLGAYSAFGGVKTELGLTLIEIADQFGLRAADDPVESLRRDQANLLNMASQLVEEGWATWVETFLAANLMESGAHPRHSMDAIVKAIQELPSSVPDAREIRNALLSGLEILFGPEDVPIRALHEGVMIIAMIGGMLDGYFGPALGQPLRYAVGELLMMQAETNLGAQCVPYAALIAANVHFDPREISLTDLREMFATKPKLNPDARLAALSRMQLKQANTVSELAARAEFELSFSVPKELKAVS